jgi:spermidine synthase
MLAAPRRGRVLVLGGGDGGVVREVLRHEGVEEVTVVEPEESLLELARAQPVLLQENGGALGSSKVRTMRADPVAFLASAGLYDVILVDLLDPEGPRRSKWFTRHFYRRLGEHLAPGGVGAVAINAAVPRAAPHAGLLGVHALLPRGARGPVEGAAGGPRLPGRLDAGLPLRALPG